MNSRPDRAPNGPQIARRPGAFAYSASETPTKRPTVAAPRRRAVSSSTSSRSIAAPEATSSGGSRTKLIGVPGSEQPRQSVAGIPRDVEQRAREDAEDQRGRPADDGDEVAPPAGGPRAAERRVALEHARLDVDVARAA